MNNSDLHERLESIDNRLIIIEQLLRISVRAKMSDKGSKLLDITREQGRINVKQVMTVINISRTYALTLMRNAEKQPGYKFIKGNNSLRTPSQLIFDADLIIKHQFKKIEELLTKNDPLPLATIMDALSLDLQEAKLCAERFSETHKNFRLDINKLVRAN
jgi:hypothetical protein